jgi:hypothetical protein
MIIIKDLDYKEDKDKKPYFSNFFFENMLPSEMWTIKGLWKLKIHIESELIQLPVDKHMEDVL